MATGLVVTILAALVFGVYPPAVRRAYAAGANPTFVIIVTTFLRAAALVGACVVRRRVGAWWARESRLAIWAGVLQAISIVGIVASLHYLPGPVTIILLFTHTTMLLLFTVARGEQALSARTLLATLVALVGVSLVVDFWGNLSAVDAKGVALAGLAAVATAGRLYAFERQLRARDPMVVGAQVFTVACLCTTAMAAFVAPVAPHTASWWGHVLLASLSLVLGTFGMFVGVARLGSFRYSLLSKLEPLFTALFSVAIAGEVLSLRQYVGMATVLAGILGYQLLQAPAARAQVDQETV